MQPIPNLISALDYSGITLLGCWVAWQVRRFVSHGLLWGLLIGCGLFLMSCAEHHLTHAIGSSWAARATWFCAISSTAGFMVLWCFTPRLIQAITKVAHQATTDALTGLHNRGSGNRILGCLQETATTPTGVLFLDIDHFKQINTKYGHAGGDKILQSTAAAIRNQVRKGDSVIRWGGEEFLIALPGCSIKEAAKIAQNILLSVRGGNQCTASIGVASLLPGKQWEDAVNLANNRMRVAKERGRDCVVINA